MASATNTTQYSATYTGPKTDAIHKQYRVLPNGIVAASYLEGTSFLNITATTASTVIKTGAGTLCAVFINGGSSTSTVTLYDNTAASGTKIGTISTLASQSPIFLPFNAAFATGLTVAATITSTDITVTYL